jgi:hypothetical protein
MTSAESLSIQTKKMQQAPKHPDEMTFIWDGQGRSDVVRKFKHPTKRTDSFSAESRDPAAERGREMLVIESCLPMSEP